MKVIVLAYSGWGYDCLKYFIQNSFNFESISLVTYERLEKDTKRLFWKNLISFAEKSNISCIKETWPPGYKWHMNNNWDILISSNWRHKIPNHIINSARLGSYNIHRSLLPNYKGTSPIQRALKNNEKEVGITIHKLSNQYDSGEIVLQENYFLSDSDNIKSVFLNLNKKIPTMLDCLFKVIKNGKLS